MRAIICEYPWQLRYIDEDDSVVISINPEVSYHLTQNGFKFIECSELCKHKELWDLYPKFTETVFSLTTRLDEILWEIDPRFENFDLPFFDRIGYIIKVCFDQTIYYTHLIREVIDLGINTIVCANNGIPTLDRYGLFESEKSIIPMIIESFKIQRINVNYHTNSEDSIVKNSSHFSFGQPKSVYFSQFKEHLSEHFLWTKILLSLYAKMCDQYSILSVGCKELDSIDVKKFKKIKIIPFNSYSHFQNSKNVWKFYPIFIQKIVNDSEILRLSSYGDANIIKILIMCIKFFSEKLEFFLEHYKKIFQYLEKSKINAIIFQTMAPFFLPNIIIYEWCRKKNLPYACWMHGGYGVYESLQGYDISDYRLSQNHFVYGKVLLDLPKDPNWILNKVTFYEKDKNLFVTGSPFFEKVYANCIKYDNLKKVILFSLGNFYGHNQFYFGHNRADSELSIWKSHYAIINVLAKFDDQYEIIIKDYPHSPQKGIWKAVVKDLKLSNTRYICDEFLFSDLLCKADLHVFSWVSTTFFQSMYTYGDICLFDDSDLTVKNRKIFENSIIFSSNLDEFCCKLFKYLIDGKFYIQDKTALKNFFVDAENASERTKIVEDVITSLIPPIK